MHGRNTEKIHVMKLATHALRIKKCDQACKNQPCECKLHRVIFSPIQNVVSHFRKLQMKAH